MALHIIRNRREHGTDQAPAQPAANYKPLGGGWYQLADGRKVRGKPEGAQ